MESLGNTSNGAGSSGELRSGTTLNYATPGAARPQVRAAAVVMFCGLGMVLLGGCFMIGILQLNSASAGFGPPLPSPPPKTAGQVVLECALYAVAFSCFGFAVYLFGVGIKWLRRLVD